MQGGSLVNPEAEGKSKGMYSPTLLPSPFLSTGQRELKRPHAPVRLHPGSKSEGCTWDTQGPDGLRETSTLAQTPSPGTASDSLSLSRLLPSLCLGSLCPKGGPTSPNTHVPRPQSRPEHSPGPQPCPRLHTCRWVQTLLSMSYTLSRESSDTKTYWNIENRKARGT